MSPQEDGAGSGATGVTVFDVYGARPEPRSVRRLPRLVLDALRLVWAAGRQDVIVLVVLQTAAGLGIALPVLVGRQLLDELFSTGDLAELTGLLPQVGVLVAVTVALGAAQAVAQERDQILTEVVSLHVQRRILDITAGLDLLHFDTAELYDRLQRASFGAQFGPFHLVRGLVQLVGAVFGVLGATIALVILEPLLVPVAILAGVPLWVASLRRGRLYWEFITRFTPAERERGYVQGLLGERSAAKEVRAFALAQPLRARWDRLSGERLDELRVVVRRQLRLALLGDLASAALLGGALLLLTALLLSGRLSVAEAGAGAAALLLLGERLRGAAGGADILFEAAPFMRDLAAFLGIERELEPPGTRPSAPLASRAWR